MSTDVIDQKALARLKARIANQPTHVNNSCLPAGSPMYYYCKICGHPSDTLSESHMRPPRKTCSDCSDLKEMTKLTSQTLIELASELE